MSDIFEILKILTEHKVNFCFQCQGKNNYYNLSIDDPRGVNHSISFDSLNKIQQSVTVMWGHILVKNKPLPRPF